METTEFVAESFLDALRDRFDPYYKHPKLSKVLLLTKPTFLDANYEELRRIQDLITEGRKLKGSDGTYAKCLNRFQQAVLLGKDLDKRTPLCAFSERLFAIGLTVVSLFVGWVLGLLTAR